MQCWLNHLPGTWDIQWRGYLKNVFGNWRRCCYEHCKGILQHVTGNNNKLYFIENFALLAKRQSICMRDLIWSYFLLGVWVLAPMKQVQKLKTAILRQDYTTLPRKVVDITRATKKSGVTRQVKFGVMLLQPHESKYTCHRGILYQQHSFCSIREALS